MLFSRFNSTNIGQDVKRKPYLYYADLMWIFNACFVGKNKKFHKIIELYIENRYNVGFV
jgi:hypothetical protein